MFFVKFGPIFITKSLNVFAISVWSLIFFFLKAYFLYASVIFLLLVNNFRYGIPHFTHVGSVLVKFIVIIHSFGFY